MMQNRSIHIVMLTLIAASCIGLAAMRGPDPSYKNLQVLPKDIPMGMLDSIMESYNTALGVKCSFCHAPVAGNKDSLDFASDKNSMKENAREMIRLTRDINKQYFYTDKRIDPLYLNRVHCNTCHKGDAWPED